MSNLQFLDNVLPVIHQLRKEGGNQKVSLVFSAEHILVTAGSSHPLLEIALSLVDEIWFPIGRRWRLVKRGENTQKFAKIAKSSSRISRYAFRYRAKKLIEKATFMHQAENLILDFRALQRHSYLLAAMAVTAEKIICLTHGEPQVEFRRHSVEARKVSDLGNLQTLEEFEAPRGTHVFLVHTEHITKRQNSRVSITRLEYPPRLDTKWLSFIEDFYRLKNENYQVMQIKPFGIFFSRPSSKTHQPGFTLNPASSIKQNVLDEVRQSLIEKGLSPVFVKHPHERIHELDLTGWITSLNVHNLYLLQHASATFSFGTSIAAESDSLGVKMIDYRPDDEAAIARGNWYPYAKFVSAPKELRYKLDEVLTRQHATPNQNHSSLPMISNILSK